MSDSHRVSEPPSSRPPPVIDITHYQRSRFWAIWLDDELLAVTVYRKGAEAIRAELERRRQA